MTRIDPAISWPETLVCLLVAFVLGAMVALV